MYRVVARPQISSVRYLKIEIVNETAHHLGRMMSFGEPASDGTLHLFPMDEHHRDGDGTATSSCIGGPNCGDLSRGGRFKADEGDPIVQSMSLAIGLTIFLVATISVLLHWCRQRRQRMRATTPGIPTICDPASTAPSLVIAVLNPGDTELSTIAAAHHSQLVLARPSPVACESDSPPVPAAVKDARWTRDSAMAA